MAPGPGLRAAPAGAASFISPRRTCPPPTTSVWTLPGPGCHPTKTTRSLALIRRRVRLPSDLRWRDLKGRNERLEPRSSVQGTFSTLQADRWDSSDPGQLGQPPAATYHASSGSHAAAGRPSARPQRPPRPLLAELPADAPGSDPGADTHGRSPLSLISIVFGRAVMLLDRSRQAR